MHPSGNTIICKGSKECIGEEIVDQILHLIQIELLVRVETYTQLADGTILAHISNVKLGNYCSLHWCGCKVVTASYTWFYIKKNSWECDLQRVATLMLEQDQDI